MSFTTKKNLKLFLNKSELSVQESLLIDLILPLVDSMVSNYCGWEILAKDYEDKKFDGNNLSELDIKVYPINELTKCTVADTQGTITDLTDIVAIKESEGIIYLPVGSDVTTFTKGTQNVVLSYNAGFSVIPGDLEFAALNLAVIHYQRIVGENIGVSKESFNTITTEYSKIDIPPQCARILDRYRRFIVV